MLEPKIVEMPPRQFVGLEAAFIHGLSPETTNYKVIPPLWEAFSARAKEVPHRVGKAMFGVIFGLPEAERKHRHELQYIAGVEVSQAGELPAGMVLHTVPAGTFAGFIHRGPIQKIAETVGPIYREWLPQSGYRHADIADIELYDHRFDGCSKESEMEYWVSVVPAENLTATK